MKNINWDGFSPFIHNNEIIQCGFSQTIEKMNSGQLIVESWTKNAKRETLNEQQATPPTNPLFFNYLLHQISIFVAIAYKIGAGLKLGSRYRKFIMQYTLVH